MNTRSLVKTAVAAGVFLAARSAVRTSRRFDLLGRNVLVTGGSRGLGLVLARQLAERGARVAICARDLNELERAREDLARRGATVLSVQCDLTDRDQVDLMVCSVRSKMGPIDVLVNNAGIIGVGPLEAMTVEDFDDAMKTHFYGPLYTTLACLPDMKKARGGRIVNISSIGGLVTVPHLTPYVASKFALTGLSQSLRGELMKDGIYVTSVYPGLMRTGSPRNVDVKGRYEVEYAMFKLMDSLPVTSMAANRAARQIINAFVHGQANVVLSIQAKLAAKFHAVFPSLSNDLSALANLALPGAQGRGTRAVKGYQAETKLTRSALTGLTGKAAMENNETRVKRKGAARARRAGPSTVER